MKKQNLWIASLLVMIFTSCTFVKNNATGDDSVKFKKSELLGQWVRMENKEDIKESEFGKIDKISLKKDLTAEIVLLDSTVFKTVSGSWEFNKETKLGSSILNIQFKSDIVLTFDWNSNNRQVVTISVREQNKKKILTSPLGKFKKE